MHWAPYSTYLATRWIGTNYWLGQAVVTTLQMGIFYLKRTTTSWTPQTGRGEIVKALKTNRR